MRSKYRNIRTIVDGHKFASKKEARRYTELRLLEKAGKIGNLLLQVRFPIYTNGYTVCHYVADFEYWENGMHVIEDCKGFRTPLYKLKAALMQAIRGITIKET